MKKSRIIKVSLGIIGLWILIFFIFTYKFEKKLKILDCESTYSEKLFEKPEPGYLNFSESNAKNMVALCLCEKYILNKNKNYKNEILKLYEKQGIKYGRFQNSKSKIDSICKYRNQIFFKSFNL